MNGGPVHDVTSDKNDVTTVIEHDVFQITDTLKRTISS